MKRLVYNKWYGWISNDPSIWWTGSFYNMEWVDTTKDLSYVQLSKSFDDISYINSRVNGKVIGSLYSSNTNYLELTYDGYLSWLLNNDINNWVVIKGSLWNGCNIWKMTIWTWVEYWFLITASYFTKWAYDSTKYALWYYDEWWTWINPDSEFDSTTWWTIWTWWAIAWWQATHTSWTAVLSRTMTCDTATTYRIAVSHSNCIAWTCAIKVAWTTRLTLTASTDTAVQVATYVSAWISELLEFVPSTDFNWSISYCRIQKVNAISTAKTFNETAPYTVYSNIIYVWNGTKVTAIDITTWTPDIQDVITIDNDFTIVWITRISDQFYIYASNGSNSRQYMWNWIDGSADRIITWVDKPIMNVANFANVDYVIVWTDRRQWLYLVNWYQLQPIIVTDDYISDDARIYFNSLSINNIETIWNKLLISGDKGVYTYWNRTPWVNPALIKQFLHNWWWITNIFYSENLWYSIFAYFYWTLVNTDQTTTAWNYRIQIYFPEWGWNEKYTILNQRITGWIETHPLIWEIYSNIKNTEKITIWAEIEEETQINIYQKSTYYANLYATGNSYTWAVWDTYTYSWRTFTILNIIKPSTSNGYLLHCSYTGTELTWTQYWTFTKATWTWPTTIYIERVRYGYKLLFQATDTTKLRHTYNCPSQWNKTQYAIELISHNETNTPRLYDFNLYFEENTND